MDLISSAVDSLDRPLVPARLHLPPCVSFFQNEMKMDAFRLSDMHYAFCCEWREYRTAIRTQRAHRRFHLDADQKGLLPKLISKSADNPHRPPSWLIIEHSLAGQRPLQQGVLVSVTQLSPTSFPAPNMPITAGRMVAFLPVRPGGRTMPSIMHDKLSSIKSGAAATPPAPSQNALTRSQHPASVSNIVAPVVR